MSAVFILDNILSERENMPPFEALPFWYQTMLIVFSVITLVVGGSVFWRMLKSVFGKDDEKE